MDRRKPVIAVAGASGFVGRALIRKLAERAEVVALGRRAPLTPRSNVTFRECHLERYEETEPALQGAELAVYLVHAMLPTAHLVQATFQDLDLLSADNFARAARRAGIRRIVYLGGLTPKHGRLSTHLASRREVEEALERSGAEVLTLRAGMVIGPGGSSFEIVDKLVERLPVMTVPSWGDTKTQPIALGDVVELLEHALFAEKFSTGAYDVGGSSQLTYREMLARTAKLRGKSPSIIPLPFDVPIVSLMWVSLISGVPLATTMPLLASLRRDMVASHGRELQADSGVQGASFDEMVGAAIEGSEKDAPTVTHGPPSPRALEVLSVQRLGEGIEQDARDIAREYFDWVERIVAPLLRVERDGDRIALFLRGVGAPMFVFREDRERSSRDRAVYAIRGGLSVGKGSRGTFEFRLVGKTLLASVYGFAPRLPWLVYASTQAPLHKVIMHAFGRHVARLAREERGKGGRPGQGDLVPFLPDGRPVSV